MSEPRGMTGLSLPDLRSLLRALERGQVGAPITEAALTAMGFGAKAQHLAPAFRDLDDAGVRAVLETAIAERVHRPPPHLDLVWTGPEAQHATARDTAIVVRQLFEQATQSVLVGGFSFDHGEEILRPLHVAMRDRNVSATFFLHIERGVPSTEQIDRFFVANWPFGPPRPDVYYDARTADPGSPWASLHAKCVVVDERRTLITSANFTDRGQTRNIEAGVLIDDRDFARRLLAQWHGLVSSDHVRRYEG